MAFSEEPLGELEASIREHGVLQPVLVRPVPGAPGTYELIAGERRWRAASAAGLRTVPAVVRPLDDRGALEAALVENLQREDLNALERARAYRALMDEFGLTQEAVARRVGRSQPSVANTLRLLSLPPEVQSSLESGRITEGHGRALLGIADQSRLLQIWKQIESKGLSVREVEKLARVRGISRGMRQKARGLAQDINIIEQNLQSILGAPVRVVVKRRGGEIRIMFHSHEDMDRILDRLATLGERA
jgi:ParB family chromosome partitioning protein